MPRARNLSPWAYWRLRHDATADADPCPVDDLVAFDGWRVRARERLAELMGPRPEAVAPDVEVLDEWRESRYSVQKLVFDSEPVMAVPALLLVPDRVAPGPAVLALHGHGHNKETVCGIDGGDAARRAQIDSDCADYGRRLAERGYVVLATDHRGFGERAGWQEADRYFCDLNLVHAYAAGANPLAQNVHDLRVALDVLAAHPLVDPAAIGVVGWSYGGTLTQFLTAVDDRVAAAVVCCAFSSFRSMHKVPGNMCGSQVLPGMLGRLEHLDLAALAAPMPLLVTSGRDDILFPADVAASELAALSRLYGGLGFADGRVEHRVFDGEHRWDREPAEAFLARWLPVDGEAAGH